MVRLTSFLGSFCLILAMACGGGGGGGGSTTSTPPAVSVDLSPTASTVTVSHTKQFTATVHNSSNSAVTFSVTETGGGTVDGTGLYTAPTVAGTYHVVATSQADASAKSTATLTVVDAPAVTSFVAAKVTITSGTGTTLTATFSGGTASVNHGLGSVTSGIPASTGNLAATTTYTLTVTNAAGDTATAMTAVTVVAAPVITSFMAAQSLIGSGSSTTLTAVFSGGTGLVDHSVGAITSGVAKSTGAVNADTTFTLTVTNAAGDTMTSQAVVTVVTAAPIISTFTATPATITLGHSSTLAWTVTGQDVTSLSIDQGVGPVLGQNSIPVSPTTGTTYTLTATNPKGSVTRTATVTVVFAPQIGSFTASPTTIVPNAASSITPVFTQGTGAIDQGIGAVTTGTAYPTGNLAAAKTYTLTVTNAAGDSVSQTLTVHVDSGTFTAVPGAMSSVRVGHTATLMAGGKILIAGGAGIPGYTATADEFDPSANAGAGGFSPTANNLSATRAYDSAVLLPNGKVLVLGGLGNGGTSPRQLDTADLYDPATRTFSPSAHTMAHLRQQCSATLLQSGKVLIAGGFNDTEQSLGSVELYDSATDTFTLSAGTMGSPRWGHQAVLLPDGKVLIAGGNIANGNPAQLELYDPGSDSFLPTGDTNTISAWGGVTLLQDGTVLLSMSNLNGQGSVIYDPATGHGTATGSVNLQRYNAPTATLMADGRVLIAGNSGNPGMDVATDCELYSTSTGQFSFTGNPGDRWEHTANLLEDGRVLLAGGFDSGVHTSLATGTLFNAGPAVPAPVPDATVTAPATATHGTAGLSASVTVTAGATYVWEIQGGSITGGIGTQNITFTAGAAGTLALDCLVTSNAGVPSHGGASITVN